MRHKKWLRKIFFCMALSCITATGALAAGNIVISDGNGGIASNINTGAITDSVTGTDPEVFGVWVNNLSSYTFNGTIDVEANGETSAAAIGAYANDTDALSVGGIISASANATTASALGIVANNSGTILNTSQITTYANGTDAYAAGILTLNSGALNNTGAISSTAEGTDFADARGIQVEGSSGNIANSGSLVVSAADFAFGIYADGAGNIDNEGNITVTSDNMAAGIYANNTGTVANSGAIVVTGYQAAGIGANNTGAISNSGDISATAVEEAAGIYAENVNGGISNSAGVSVSASANAADGIYAEDTTGSVSNTGIITAIGEWWAAGIHTSETGAISNEGTINATASRTSEAEAYGIRSTDTSGAITNTGTINADASRAGEAEAKGIRASSTDGAIANEGTINANAYRAGEAEATGIHASFTNGTVSNIGTINANASRTNEAEATGIRTWDTAGSVSNTGTMVISASGDEAEATGIRTGRTVGDVTNTYNITATAESDEDEAEAYGIRTYDTNGNISNGGTISAMADVDTYDSYDSYTSIKANAYGIRAYDTVGDIGNTGNIYADAYTDAYASGSYASADSYANAFGIQAGGYMNGTVSNTGLIQSYAESYSEASSSYSSDDYTYSTADADAYGINVDDGMTGNIDNSATIWADSYAYGYGYAYDSYGNSYVNTYAESQSYGIKAGDNLTGNIINSGDIWAESYANSYASTYDYESYSSSYANAEAKASGIEVDDFMTGDISNAGYIWAEASAYAYAAEDYDGYSSSYAEASAFGINVDEGMVGNISNTGTIWAYANTGYSSDDEESYYGYSSASAFGINAESMYGEISNSGEIYAEAYNDDSYDSYGSAEAYGIVAGGADLIENTETGMISVTSDYFGVGILAFDSDDEMMGFVENGDGYPWPSIVNNGSIYMDAYRGAGIAIGSGSWDVYNPGFIYTGIGNDMRTLAVGMEEDYAAARLVDDFRIIFDGVPYDMEGPSIMAMYLPEDAYVPQILVGENGELYLNDATLVAQAGKNIVWNTPYRVIENHNEYYDEELGEWVADNSNIYGEFAALDNPNPNINVSWVDSDETGADAEVIFSYDPQGSTPAAGMRLANLGAIQNSNLIQKRSFSQLLAQHIKKQQDTLLADSGTTASDAGFLVARSGDDLENAMFIRPYAKAIDRSTSGGMGYDGNLYGFVLGYERSLSPELTLGAHAGIGFGTLDFKGDGYDENDEDQTIYSLGIHAAYNPDAWHFDGSATFYMAEHEYDGKTGNFLEIDEDDDYTSYGAEAEAIAGYVIPSGNWAVMPYAGLGYSWINADSHSTDADDSDWDTEFDSVDEHIVRSILGAQLSADLMWGETKVVPSLGVRWEYALTDNDIEIEQSTLGSPSVTAEDDISRSSIIGDASIGLSKGALSFELGGTAEYNDDYDAYGGWLTLRYAF